MFGGIARIASSLPFAELSNLQMIRAHLAERIKQFLKCLDGGGPEIDRQLTVIAIILRIGHEMHAAEEFIVGGIH
jgi:hypothetical protein